MIKQFISNLGVKYVRPEGQEFVCVCPQCEQEPMHVNSTTGLWHCKHGCGNGNPFSLVKIVRPGIDDKDVFAILDQFGLNKGQSQPAQIKPKNIDWFNKLLVDPTEDELQQLCDVKGIQIDMLKRLRPMMLRAEGIVCLPVHNPSNMQQGACGYIRVRKDGQLIHVKSSGKDEKYPAIGNIGLLGVQYLAKHPFETILFCEGWRDMLAAMSLGYAATASSAGASSFKDEWMPVFKKKHVVIIMDEDAAGVKAANRAADKIKPIAASVKVVRLPFEYQETKGKDLYNLVMDAR